MILVLDTDKVLPGDLLIGLPVEEIVAQDDNTLVFKSGGLQYRLIAPYITVERPTEGA